MTKNVKCLIIEFSLFIVMLTVLCLINFIDLPVVTSVYLPVFIITAIFIIFKKYYIGHIFLVSAGLGLITEYIIHLMNADEPNMSGAFLNTGILVVGLVVGIIVQIYKNKNK